MPTTHPTLDDLSRGIDAGFPVLTDEERGLSLEVHRALAEGEPVAPRVVAARAGVRPGVVTEALERWPGVFLDDDGRVVGFWGLALDETPHRFEVEGRTLYTWCAWDALFLPEILRVSATVRSVCPVTAREVTLEVSGNCVTALEPATAVLSMLDASAWEGIEGNNVISTCCNDIHLFADRDAALEWKASRGREDVLILTVDEAFELGKLCNRLRYGSAL